MKKSKPVVIVSKLLVYLKIAKEPNFELLFQTIFDRLSTNWFVFDLIFVFN
jgi:hypothetical protein